MSGLTLVLAAGAAAPAASPEAYQEVEIASAQAQVRIVHAVIVRQTGGIQNSRFETPRHQITRGEGEVLVEFY